MAMEAVQVPTSCFMQTPKSKRVRAKIRIYQALKLLESRLISLKYWLGLSEESTASYCPNALRWVFLQCIKKKNFGESMPPDHPREAPTFNGHFCL